MKKTYTTNYKTATKWCGNDLVLCNNIAEIDPSIYENLKWDDIEPETEICQWYITNASEDDVEFLEEHFNLIFAYSNLLNLYILCVPFYGMSWEDIQVETDINPVYKDSPF